MLSLQGLPICICRVLIMLLVGINLSNLMDRSINQSNTESTVLSKITYFKKNGGERGPLAGKPKVRPDASSYLAAYMLSLVCHVGDSVVTGKLLRSLPRRTHEHTHVIRTY